MEVVLENGKKVLNTSSSNYSYGSSQRVLRTGLAALDFNDRFKSVLVLGMGAGSVVDTIRNEFNSDVFLDLVEVDTKIIEVAKSEFGIEGYEKIKISHADAAKFLKASSKKFDLIIIDLFIGDVIPSKFRKDEFYANLQNKLTKKGALLFNTIRKTLPENQLEKLKSHYESEGFSSTILWRIEDSNNVLIAHHD